MQSFLASKWNNYNPDDKKVNKVLNQLIQSNLGGADFNILDEDTNKENITSQIEKL